MIFNLWEFLAFLANSLVFLLIGLDIDLPQLWANLWPIAVGVVAVLTSRAAVVYGLSWLYSWGRDRGRIPMRWRHVLFWGGLRGAIRLALTLSLPVTLPDRDMLKAMAFGVILFTLMGQGTTIQFLLRRLGLIQRPGHVIQRERHMGRLLATQAGLRQLEHLRREGILIEEMWRGLREDYVQTQNALTGDLNQLFAEHAELERELIIQARREALQAERAVLIGALRRGLLSDEVFNELRTDIDRRLEAVALIQAAVESRGSSETGD
jgi:CPA1 family monovalent cation:H+ antiporter